MIVIGLDVHKQSVTAVAVDGAGRPLEEKVIRVGSDELLAWAAALDTERWAVEDCRQLTGRLFRPARRHDAATAADATSDLPNPSPRRYRLTHFEPV